MDNTYYKRDIDYIVIQEKSLQNLVDAVNKMIGEFNNRDTSDEKTEIVMRIVGGILREDFFGTYTQVVAKTEYLERIGWN